MGGKVLYDNKCNLCIGIVDFLKRRDILGRLHFISSDSDEGRSLVAEAALSENETNTLIYFTQNKFYFRSSAVLNILKDLGGALSLLYVFIIVPASIRDYFYRLIARNRYRINFRN